MAFYSRITHFASTPCHGEDAYCRPCGEFKAICPDCAFPVCIFCEGECPDCGESIF